MKFSTIKGQFILSDERLVYSAFLPSIITDLEQQLLFIVAVFEDEMRRQSVMDSSATLLSLTPYTNYSVSVAAFTQAGTGVRSEAQFCLTDEDGKI